MDDPKIERTIATGYPTEPKYISGRVVIQVKITVTVDEAEEYTAPDQAIREAVNSAKHALYPISCDVEIMQESFFEDRN